MKEEKSKCKVVINTEIDKDLKERTAEEFAKLILSIFPLDIIEKLMNKRE